VCACMAEKAFEDAANVTCGGVMQGAGMYVCVVCV